jgi:hypothetical protein
MTYQSQLQDGGGGGGGMKWGHTHLKDYTHFIKSTGKNDPHTQGSVFLQVSSAPKIGSLWTASIGSSKAQTKPGP